MGHENRRHPNRSTWLLSGHVRQPGKRGSGWSGFHDSYFLCGRGSWLPNPRRPCRSGYLLSAEFRRFDKNPSPPKTRPGHPLRERNLRRYRLFQKEQKESLAVMQKKLRIQSAQEKDIKYLEASYNLLATKFYNQVPYANPKAVETTLEFVATEEPRAKGADPKSFVDESLVKEVEASGFIRTLYDTEYR